MFKNVLAIALVAVGLNATGQTMYPGGISGCVARFPFGNPESSGNILQDVSGNSNSGTPHSITATTGWRGMPNTAGKFTGNSSYGQVPFATNLNFQHLTMIALVKFDGFYSGNCQNTMIFSRGNGFGGGAYCMNVTDAIYDGGNCASYDPLHQMRGDYVGNNLGFATPLTAPVVTGQWYFLAGAFDGSTYSAYQVVMDSTIPLTSLSPMYQVKSLRPMGTNSDDLYLGMGVNPSYPYWFNGSMDEAALFDRALDSSEIFKVFNYMRKGVTSATPNSVGTVAQGNPGVDYSVQNGQLHFAANDGKAIGQIMITTAQGQVVAARNASTQGLDVDVSNYAKGIFFVKIARNGQVFALKVSNL